MARARRRIVWLLLAVLVAALALPFLNINRYRSHMTAALSRALGREVTAGQVWLRMLPRPGVTLQNVTIAEDPRWGAEPVLRAEQVTADLRISSLWRGRLEIARLQFSYPSLNLARNQQGRWNLEALLERGAQGEAAPTAQQQAEARPRFPYVEFTGGRINFKQGAEKSVFILSEADLSLWLASENRWQMRLRARPLRTDVALADTGTLRLQGSFAPSAGEAALDLRASLLDSQMGQLTRMLYGRDRGWRGSVDASLSLRGPVTALQVEADATVKDFRRYDIMGGEQLTVYAQCSARLARGNTGRDLQAIACAAPNEAGVLSLTGEVANLFGGRLYDLALEAEALPASRLVEVLQHIKRDVAPDLVATGELHAGLRLQGEAAEAVWKGSGEVRGLRLHSRELEQELPFSALRFTVGGDGRRRTDDFFVLSFERLRVPLNAPPLAEAAGVFSGQGYQLQLRGGAEAGRLLQLARTLGMAVPATEVSGAANVNLRIAGLWRGFEPPLITGTAELRRVRAAVAGLHAPLQIISGKLELTPQAAALRNANLTFAGSSTQLSGWVSVERNCPARERCAARFQLQSPKLASAELAQLMAPGVRRRMWPSFRNQEESLEWLRKIRAQGRISTAWLEAGEVRLERVSAAATLEDGVLTLQQVTGHLFGGAHRGNWQLDFRGSAPTYSGHGVLDGILLERLLAAAESERPPASGRIRANYRLALAGWDRASVARSAAGALIFEASDGVLRRVVLEPEQPLRFHQWAGTLELRQGEIAVKDSVLRGAGGIYKVSGTASFAQRLDLRLVPENGNGSSYRIGGTVQQPEVAAIAAERQTAQTH